eukprot:CAMPEP_0178439132 /NCGR_PEP_ID=MMETSP0689_2-20121128/35987_1 /TAXON_ID=160604 /ORGANISM="Amphidinium massartii, Strain CS-259" /LENGTH=494 /DNA_ID=CAMNT_0020061629 /DNA_START=12 /DNA_END=1492 /DNA_ORIENTATION=+
MAPAVRLDEIKIEDIDFEVVAKCEDKRVVKRYIQLLEDDGCYFQELLKACKDKLLELSPKDYYQLYPRVASSTEVDDITADLLRWQDAVTETDELLKQSRKNKAVDDEPSALPIRGQEAVVARPNIKDKGEGADEDQREKENRSGGSNPYARDTTRMKDYYRAWDAVDVDAMEHEMEEEERRAEEARRRHFEDLKDEQRQLNTFSSVDAGVKADTLPEAQRKHLADSEKEKGNEAFYSKDYEEAEAYYSRSIQYTPSDPSTWANRALVRLKLENSQGALQDCEHSLALNPRYMKALHRKGKALYELGRYEEAVRSFQLALAESPGNTQINGDLMVARRKLRSTAPAAPTSANVESTRPRRPDDPPTCTIEEITDDAEPSSTVAAAPGFTRVAIEADDEEEDASAAAASSKAPGKDLPDGTGGARFQKVQIEEVSDSDSEAEGTAAPVAVASSKPSSQKTFQKVHIEEASDSEGEEEHQTLQPKVAQEEPESATA